MAQEAEAGILAGLRVLDLADEKGLPCTKFFADLGADVIKVERPGGDPTRARPPFAQDRPHPERSLYFLHYNANKRGITLNLATPDGQALFRQLARSADVVVETFRPGVLQQWGLDYPALAAVNPRIVVTSITTFGQTGPYRDYRGGELVAFALGGLMALSGEPGGPPCLAPGDLACGMASLHAALATLVALFHRHRTGRGQHIDVSVSEAAAHIGGYAVPVYSYHRQKPVRTSHAERTFELHDLYPCQDGWVRLFVLPREHWRALLDWLGNPPELCDPLFEDQQLRRENSARINPYVEALCRRYTRQQFYREGQARHIAVSPLNTPADFVESEQTRAREFFLEAEHPVVGRYRQVGPLHKYSDFPARVRRAAPLVGEHNEEILMGELGLSRADLVSLRAAGVI
ncbi:MAG TPA: CoA transferase [Chloroflexota bacterium]|nr:CoA transferase [Chloroflexota bacterium]